MAATAAVATVVLAAGTTAYSVSENKKQAKEARKTADAQQLAQEKLLAEQKAQGEAEDAAIAEADLASRRKNQARVGAAGRRDTILTSPLGQGAAGAAAQGGGKTILGG